MNGPRAIPVLLALVLVVSAGCGPGGESPGPTTQPATAEIARVEIARAAPAEGSAERAAAAINAFGLDLYRAIGSDGGNLVFSPASIALALAMARAGARGETAAQMDAVLHADAAGDLLAALNALDQALASRSGTFPAYPEGTLDVALRIANAPFAQRGLPLEPAYLATLAGDFGAGLRLVDYARDPEAARRTINAWVDEQTERRIPELLPAGAIDESTLLTLVNAIYLKAPWLDAFVEEATAPAAFTRADGSAVDVPMMDGGTDLLAYAAGDGWRAVELPYAGGKLVMTLVVPDDLAAFEAGLTPEAFAAIVAALDGRLVHLRMPRFGQETKVSLNEVLAALGMPDAFGAGRADFSGITAAAPLFITAVVHQANIDVDEKGTEAAAATAVVMAGTAAPSDEPVELTVDRPFLFALRDRPTGAILFLGRVVDPSAG